MSENRRGDFFDSHCKLLQSLFTSVSLHAGF